jgi:probable HAF family extracellular repeat protein
MSYTAVSIGTLPGHDSSVAAGVSSDGTVIVGYSYNQDGSGTTHAFRWTASGGMVDLGVPPTYQTTNATGCSADGSVVVGQSQGFGHIDAFKWTAADGCVLLGVTDLARACSADGATIVGVQTDLSGFVWTAGGVVLIPKLPSGLESGAFACSSNGAIVAGRLQDAGRVYHAFTWTSGGGLAELTDLAGSTANAAQAISADGSVVVGYAQDGSGNAEIVTWTSGTPTSLGTGTAYGCSSTAATIVGVRPVAAVDQGFSLTGGTFITLPPLSGDSNSQANGVSGDGGVIVGLSSRFDPITFGLIVTAVYWLAGSPPPTSKATVADLFFSVTPGFVDLTVASSRRAFISAAGGAQNLGAGGQAPYGTAPAVLLTSNGSPSSFAANAGRGGAFAITGGSLTAGGSAPPASSQTVTSTETNSAGAGVLGDYASGNLYAFNPDTGLDNGVQRRWLRRWRALPRGTPAAKRFAALWIDMQTGANVPEGTKPQIVLRWSDDGGHTWSDERIEAVGPLGVTALTVKFNRLGATRRFGGADRIFELSSSDQFMVAILEAGVDVT